jgi:hypothetical protein
MISVYDFKKFELHALTGQACCERCGEVIKKGTPRLGRAYTYYRWNGTRWMHLSCFSLNDVRVLTKEAFIKLKWAMHFLILRYKIELTNKGEQHG